MATVVETIETIKPRRQKRRRRLLALFVVFWIVAVGPWPGRWAAYAPLPQLPSIPAVAPPKVGPLKIGVAVVDLTSISSNRPLAGYVGRVAKANTGVRDPITARAMVLATPDKRVAIVTADLLLINRTLADAVLDRLGAADPTWKREDVFFSATHTHSGPGGFGDGLLEGIGLGWPDDKFTGQLAEKLTESVTKAAGELRPATFVHASAQVESPFIKNRTAPSEPAYRWLDLLLFREPGSNKAIATIAVFSAHATTVPSRDGRLSADYPGALVAAIEQRMGGVGLFLAGAVGSMAPPGDAQPADELTSWMGSQLAKLAARTLSGASAGDSQIALQTVGYEIPLPLPALKIAGGWTLSPLAGKMLAPSRGWFHALKIGDCLLLGTPADFSGPLAEELRDRLAGSTVVSTSFNGDYVGYILPDSYYHLPVYEPSHLCIYGPRAGDYFQSATGRLIEVFAPR